MQKKALAVLIFLTLGLGLVAGPHPCNQQSEAGRSKAVCHGMGSGMGMGSMGRDEGHTASTSPGVGLPAHGHSPANCCDIVCQHACQMPAIATAQPVAFAIASVALTVVESSDPGLPLFAHVLDHVPLA